MNTEEKKSKRISILKPPTNIINQENEEVRNIRKVRFSSNYVKEFATANDNDNHTIWDTTYEEEIEKSSNLTHSQNTGNSKVLDDIENELPVADSAPSSKPPLPLFLRLLCTTNATKSTSSMPLQSKPECGSNTPNEQSNEGLYKQVFFSPDASIIAPDASNPVFIGNDACMSTDNKPQIFNSTTKELDITLNTELPLKSPLKPVLTNLHCESTEKSAMPDTNVHEVKLPENHMKHENFMDKENVAVHYWNKTQIFPSELEDAGMEETNVVSNEILANIQNLHATNPQNVTTEVFNPNTTIANLEETCAINDNVIYLPEKGSSKEEEIQVETEFKSKTMVYEDVSMDETHISKKSEIHGITLGATQVFHRSAFGAEMEETMMVTREIHTNQVTQNESLLAMSYKKSRETQVFNQMDAMMEETTVFDNKILLAAQSFNKKELQVEASMLQRDSESKILCNSEVNQSVAKKGRETQVFNQMDAMMEETTVFDNKILLAAQSFNKKELQTEVSMLQREPEVGNESVAISIPHVSADDKNDNNTKNNFEINLVPEVRTETIQILQTDEMCTDTTIENTENKSKYKNVSETNEPLQMKPKIEIYEDSCINETHIMQNNKNIDIKMKIQQFPNIVFDDKVEEALGTANLDKSCKKSSETQVFNVSNLGGAMEETAAFSSNILMPLPNNIKKEQEIAAISTTYKSDENVFKTIESECTPKNNDIIPESQNNLHCEIPCKIKRQTQVFNVSDVDAAMEETMAFSSNILSSVKSLTKKVQEFETVASVEKRDFNINENVPSVKEKIQIYEDISMAEAQSPQNNKKFPTGKIQVFSATKETQEIGKENKNLNSKCFPLQEPKRKSQETKTIFNMYPEDTEMEDAFMFNTNILLPAQGINKQQGNANAEQVRNTDLKANVNYVQPTERVISPKFQIYEDSSIKNTQDFTTHLPDTEMKETEMNTNFPVAPETSKKFQETHVYNVHDMDAVMEETTAFHGNIISDRGVNANETKLLTTEAIENENSKAHKIEGDLKPETQIYENISMDEKNILQKDKYSSAKLLTSSEYPAISIAEIMPKEDHGSTKLFEKSFKKGTETQVFNVSNLDAAMEETIAFGANILLSAQTMKNSENVCETNEFKSKTQIYENTSMDETHLPQNALIMPSNMKLLEKSCNKSGVTQLFNATHMDAEMEETNVFPSNILISAQENKKEEEIATIERMEEQGNVYEDATKNTEFDLKSKTHIYENVSMDETHIPQSVEKTAAPIVVSKEIFEEVLPNTIKSPEVSCKKSRVTQIFNVTNMDAAMEETTAFSTNILMTAQDVNGKEQKMPIIERMENQGNVENICKNNEMDLKSKTHIYENVSMDETHIPEINQQTAPTAVSSVVAEKTSEEVQPHIINSPEISCRKNRVTQLFNVTNSDAAMEETTAFTSNILFPVKNIAIKEKSIEEFKPVVETDFKVSDIAPETVNETDFKSKIQMHEEASMDKTELQQNDKIVIGIVATHAISDASPNVEIEKLVLTSKEDFISNSNQFPEISCASQVQRIISGNDNVSKHCMERNVNSNYAISKIEPTKDGEILHFDEAMEETIECTKNLVIERKEPKQQQFEAVRKFNLDFEVEDNPNGEYLGVIKTTGQVNLNVLSDGNLENIANVSNEMIGVKPTLPKIFCSKRSGKQSSSSTVAVLEETNDCKLNLRHPKEMKVQEPEASTSIGCKLTDNNLHITMGNPQITHNAENIGVIKRTTQVTTTNLENDNVVKTVQYCTFPKNINRNDEPQGFCSNDMDTSMHQTTESKKNFLVQAKENVCNPKSVPDCKLNENAGIKKTDIVEDNFENTNNLGVIKRTTNRKTIVFDIPKIEKTSNIQQTYTENTKTAETDSISTQCFATKGIQETEVSNYEEITASKDYFELSAQNLDKVEQDIKSTVPTKECWDNAIKTLPTIQLITAEAEIYEADMVPKEKLNRNSGNACKRLEFDGNATNSPLQLMSSPMVNDPRLHIVQNISANVEITPPRNISASEFGILNLAANCDQPAISNETATVHQFANQYCNEEEQAIDLTIDKVAPKEPKIQILQNIVVVPSERIEDEQEPWPMDMSEIELVSLKRARSATPCSVEKNVIKRMDFKKTPLRLNFENSREVDLSNFSIDDLEEPPECDLSQYLLPDATAEILEHVSHALAIRLQAFEEYSKYDQEALNKYRQYLDNARKRIMKLAADNETYDKDIEQYVTCSLASVVKEAEPQTIREKIQQKANDHRSVYKILELTANQVILKLILANCMIKIQIDDNGRVISYSMTEPNPGQTASAKYVNRFICYKLDAATITASIDKNYSILSFQDYLAMNDSELSEILEGLFCTVIRYNTTLNHDLRLNYKYLTEFIKVEAQFDLNGVIMNTVSLKSKIHYGPVREKQLIEVINNCPRDGKFLMNVVKALDVFLTSLEIG